MSKTRRGVKVKQEENEIQSYINSFKEIEEPDEEPTTSGGSKKVFIPTDPLEGEDYEQIIVREDQTGEDDFKYVFIVQDEEDGGEKSNDLNEVSSEPITTWEMVSIDLFQSGEVYEFDEYEEDALDEEDDDKTKIVKVIGQSTIKKPAASQGNSHMCSYCNYTTPKRYLLARHMKCHSEDRWVPISIASTAELNALFQAPQM